MNTMTHKTLLNAKTTRGMSNAETMAFNIIHGLKNEFNRDVTEFEAEQILINCRNVMKEVNGPNSRKYLAEEIGKACCFTHFEDFANSSSGDYNELDDYKYEIMYSTYREAGECLSYLKQDHYKHNAYEVNREFIEHWDRG